MMCTTVVDLLEPLHDGELAIDEQVRVENHLALCAACHATARELREVREMMSAALAATRASRSSWRATSTRCRSRWSSQVRSEREASWPVQFARAFEDLHFVYAGLGAMSATVSCVAAIGGAALLRAGAARRLAVRRCWRRWPRPARTATRSASTSAWSCRGSTTTTSTSLEGLPEIGDAASDGAGRGRRADAGRRGRAGVVPAGQGRRRARAARDARGVDDARFRPAQRHGSPVAVNLIWLFEQTTVRAKSDRQESACWRRFPSGPARRAAARGGAVSGGPGSTQNRLSRRCRGASVARTTTGDLRAARREHQLEALLARIEQPVDRIGLAPAIAGARVFHALDRRSGRPAR